MRPKNISHKLDLTPEELHGLLKYPHSVCPIEPSSWALVRASLAADPYIQFRLHSYRVAGGGRRWTAVIFTENKNKVYVSGQGDSADAAVVDMTLKFGEMARQAEKGKK